MLCYIILFYIKSLSLYIFSIDAKPAPSVTTYFNKFQKLSASQIQSKSPSLYDPFLFPCSSNSYIPNDRLRKLRDSIASGDFLASALEDSDLNLQSKLMYLQSWEFPSGGSESELLDPYVNSVVLDEIVRLLNRSSDSSVVKIKDAVPFVPVMCKSVKSEYRLDYVTRERAFILFTTECKGSEASQFICLIQGLEMAADAAIYMSRSTALHYKDCSIPGILVYADIVQFYGVYLIEDVPVIVYLTPPLSYSNVESRKIIVRAIFACAEYLRESIRLLDSTVFNDDISLRQLQFSDEYYFYKPIKTGAKIHSSESVQYSGRVSASFISLERIMHLYQRVSVGENSSKYILFPSGLLRIPHDACEEFTLIIRKIHTYFQCGSLNLVPVIIFPHLEGWSSAKPPPEQGKEYIQLLTEAVDALNTAEVAHMDLRPANIMWRITAEKGMQLQIVDFEDAVLFGCKIRHIEDLKNDVWRQYPPMENEELHYASNYHNFWFLMCISEWIAADVTSPRDASFEEFMRLHRARVVQKFDDFILTLTASGIKL